MAPEGIVRLEGVEEVCCGAASWVRLSWVRLQDLETHYRESPGAGLGCRECLGARLSAESRGTWNTCKWNFLGWASVLVFKLRLWMTASHVGVLGSSPSFPLMYTLGGRNDGLRVQVLCHPWGLPGLRFPDPGHLGSKAIDGWPLCHLHLLKTSKQIDILKPGPFFPPDLQMACTVIAWSLAVVHRVLGIHAKCEV